MMRMPRQSSSSCVRLGSDALLSSGTLRGRRVGVVCNHASIDRGFQHIVDRLAAAEGVTLAAIFGPQHGFRSDVQDNMIETPHGDDAARRVPVYSLYSETREPTSEMLKGSKPAVVKKIQPVSIHGQISLDVYVVDPEDLEGQVSLARMGPEAIPKNLEAGDDVELHYVLGVITQITRRG